MQSSIVRLSLKRMDNVCPRQVELRMIDCMRDTYFMDALRVITRHSTVDKRVNRKLMAVLSSWRDQYKDDPNMAFVASLYQQFKTESKNELALFMGVESMEDEAKIKREEKLAAKEKSRKEEEERKAQQLKQIDALQQQGRRPRFDFERVRQLTYLSFHLNAHSCL